MINFKKGTWYDKNDILNKDKRIPLSAKHLNRIEDGIVEALERTSDLNNRTEVLESQHNRVINFSPIPAGTYVAGRETVSLSYTISNFTNKGYVIFVSSCNGINNNGNGQVWVNITSVIDEGYIGLGRVILGAGYDCYVKMNISSNGEVVINLTNEDYGGGALNNPFYLPTLYMFSAPLGVETF